MADYSLSYTLATAVTGKTKDENYQLYHNLKAACDNIRNNGLVAYSKIESATLEASGDLNTSSNPAMMGVYWLNSSGSYDKITTSEQDIQIGGKLGERWTTGLSVTSKFESENSNSGYIKSSYGGTSANHVRVSFVHALLLISFTYSTKYKLTISFNKPRAIVSVSKSGEGTVSGAGTYHWGNSYTITATPATGYRFVKWSDGDTNASRTFTVDSSLITAYETSKSYQAIFEKLTYTVTFKDENGSTLKTETVQHGAKPTPPTTPTKADTAQWKYTFDGWYDGNGNKWTTSTTITGAVTYTARYNSTVQKYTVRWYNYDGSLLETDTNVAYGTKPTYNGATPTKAGNAEHSYQFAGWNYNTDNGITPTLGTTYIDITAQFTEIDNTYTVKWVNEGKVIETDTLVPYGARPDYNGATPTKASDAQYDYTFIGWSTSVSDPAKPEDELETVEGDVTYTAVYSATVKFYSIKVILFDSEETYVREYNTPLTIDAPKVKGYRFVKWSDDNTNATRTITVTGEATYQAIYEAIPIPTYVNDIRAKAAYIDLNSKIIFIVIDGAVPETTPDNNTVDDWRFNVVNTIPIGDSVKAVEQIYRNATKIYQA